MWIISPRWAAINSIEAIPGNFPPDLFLEVVELGESLVTDFTNGSIGSENDALEIELASIFPRGYSQLQEELGVIWKKFQTSVSYQLISSALTDAEKEKVQMLFLSNAE